MTWILLIVTLVGCGWLVNRFVLPRVAPGVVLAVTVPLLALLLVLQFLPLVIPNAETPTAAAAQEAQLDLKIPLKTLTGEDTSMAKLDAELIFLNFWATWCGPCRAEMPAMAKLFQELESEGLAMVAVTDEDAETVGMFLEETDYPFKILLDPKGELFRESAVMALPTTLILNKDGTVLVNHLGAYQWDDPAMVAKVRSMIGK